MIVLVKNNLSTGEAALLLQWGRRIACSWWRMRPWCTAIVVLLRWTARRVCGEACRHEPIVPSCAKRLIPYETGIFLNCEAANEIPLDRRRNGRN